MKIKYDINAMKFMSVFESLTRAKLKDAFENEGVQVFVVQEGEIGKAIGKGGANIKKIEGLLKKKIRIVEYSDDPEQFIRNAVYPLKVEKIDLEGDVYVLTAVDSNTRGLLIGRAAQNLRSYEAIVKRFFPISELKVN